MKTTTDHKVQGAILAAKFAQQCKLPAGNMWEPGIAAKIANDLQHDTLDNVESKWRFQLFGIR